MPKASSQTIESNDSKDTYTSKQKRKKTFIVISGDGGGVKTIIPTVFLDKLSEESRLAVHDLSFLNVGCSGSSISLGGLIIPDDENTHQSKRTPKEVIESYIRNSPIIFPFKKKVWSVYQKNIIDNAGLTTKFNKLVRFFRRGHSYDIENLEAVLNHEFGDLKAYEVTKPFVFPTTNFKETGSFKWFTNQRELARKYEHVYWVPTMRMADIIGMCTRPNLYFKYDSKTFTYFDPNPDENGNFKKQQLEIYPTDGAYFAGSPELFAYEYAKTLIKAQGYKEDEYRIVTLSISTGKRTIINDLDTLNGEKAKFLGIKLGILGQLNATETIADTAMTLPYRASRDLIKEIHNRNGDLYLRFDADIQNDNPQHPSGSLTDASEKNFEKLINFTHNNIILENTDLFEELIEIIKRVADNESIEDIAKKHLKADYSPLKADFNPIAMAGACKKDASNDNKTKCQRKPNSSFCPRCT